MFVSKSKINDKHDDFVWNDSPTVYVPPSLIIPEALPSTSSQTNEADVINPLSINNVIDISNNIKIPPQSQQTQATPDSVNKTPDFYLKTLLESWNQAHILDHLRVKCMLYIFLLNLNSNNINTLFS